MTPEQREQILLFASAGTNAKGLANYFPQVTPEEIAALLAEPKVQAPPEDSEPLTAVIEETESRPAKKNRRVPLPVDDGFITIRVPAEDKRGVPYYLPYINTKREITEADGLLVSADNCLARQTASGIRRVAWEQYIRQAGGKHKTVRLITRAVVQLDGITYRVYDNELKWARWNAVNRFLGKHPVEVE